MANCLFTTPVAADTVGRVSIPCSSAVPTVLQNASVNLFKSAAGYSYRGTIYLNSIRYDITLNISQAGDQLGGYIDILKFDTKTKLLSTLPRIRSSYPNLPIKVTWDGIKFPGIKDTVSVHLEDKITLGVPTGTKNTSVNLSLALYLIDSSTNNTIDSAGSSGNKLIGSDAKNWRLSSPLNRIGVTWENVKDTSFYPKAYGIYFYTADFEVALVKNGVKIGGELGALNTLDGVSSKRVDYSFATDYVVTQYNSKFPWTNTFVLYDNRNVDMSVLNIVNLIPPMPNDYRIYLTATINGVGA